MKQISLYVKGGEHDAGFYYRFHQYFREMDVYVRHNTMYSDDIYHRYLPVLGRPIWIKVWLWCYSCARVFKQMVADCIKRPDIIVISRRLVSRWSPQIINLLLLWVNKKGTKVIWDFDDNIRASKECDKRAFELFCRLSSNIIVASNHLAELIPEQYGNKIIYMPSTDGELVKHFNSQTQCLRKALYEKEIRIIWIGTQVSLHYVDDIMPYLEQAGAELRNRQKELVLTVVCDKELNYEPKNITTRNIKWTREITKEELMSSHIGIMPLAVTEFTKGKGGFKLIQYLSIGLPVIATGVGINKEIIQEGVGFTTTGLDDETWTEGIVSLSLNLDKWDRYSKKAHQVYLEKFSAERNYEKWEELLCS